MPPHEENLGFALSLRPTAFALDSRRPFTHTFWATCGSLRFLFYFHKKTPALPLLFRHDATFGHPPWRQFGLCPSRLATFGILRFSVFFYEDSSDFALPFRPPTAGSGSWFPLKKTAQALASLFWHRKWLRNFGISSCKPLGPLEVASDSDFSSTKEALTLPLLFHNLWWFLIFLQEDSSSLDLDVLPPPVT